MTTQNPQGSHSDNETADLVRSVALSSARLWEEVLERLVRVERSQVEITQTLSRLQAALPSGAVQQAELAGRVGPALGLPSAPAPLRPGVGAIEVNGTEVNGRHGAPSSTEAATEAISTERSAPVLGTGTSAEDYRPTPGPEVIATAFAAQGAPAPQLNDLFAPADASMTSPHDAQSNSPSSFLTDQSEPVVSHMTGPELVGDDAAVVRPDVLPPPPPPPPGFTDLSELPPPPPGFSAESMSSSAAASSPPTDDAGSFEAAQGSETEGKSGRSRFGFKRKNRKQPQANAAGESMAQQTAVDPSLAGLPDPPSSAAVDEFLVVAAALDTAGRQEGVPAPIAQPAPPAQMPPPGFAPQVVQPLAPAFGAPTAPPEPQAWTPEAPVYAAPAAQPEAQPFPPPEPQAWTPEAPVYAAPAAQPEAQPPTNAIEAPPWDVPATQIHPAPPAEATQAEVLLPQAHAFSPPRPGAPAATDAPQDAPARQSVEPPWAAAVPPPPPPPVAPLAPVVPVAPVVPAGPAGVGIPPAPQAPAGFSIEDLRGDGAIGAPPPLPVAPWADSSLAPAAPAPVLQDTASQPVQPAPWANAQAPDVAPATVMASPEAPSPSVPQAPAGFSIEDLRGDGAIGAPPPPPPGFASPTSPSPTPAAPMTIEELGLDQAMPPPPPGFSAGVPGSATGLAEPGAIAPPSFGSAPPPPPAGFESSPTENRMSAPPPPAGFSAADFSGVDAIGGSVPEAEPAPAQPMGQSPASLMGAEIPEPPITPDFFARAAGRKRR